MLRVPVCNSSSVLSDNDGCQSSDRDNLVEKLDWMEGCSARVVCQIANTTPEEESGDLGSDASFALVLPMTHIALGDIYPLQPQGGSGSSARKAGHHMEVITKLGSMRPRT